ncbi:MAG TPA: amino acid adenylation domain-containing protein [Blastocatellia bacterium]|nr:amino acid adenylation domain-containing protein [Blastocatellia bacterium]
MTRRDTQASITETDGLKDLTSEQRALLMLRLRKNKVSKQPRVPAGQPAISPARRDRELPLSFAQHRMWFLNQLEPESAAYHITTAIKFTGDLNVPALKHSLNRIIKRHEVLRTTFSWANGKPVQVIAPAMRAELPVIDLRGLGDERQAAEIKRLSVEEALKPFDLQRGPLCRVALLKLKEREHVMLGTTHHIVYDGWSVGVFTRELAAFYDSFISGTELTLPDLRVQYADFACWQHEWLSGDVLEAQIRYWKEQLGDASEALNLPTDRPRPALQTYRGRARSLELTAELSNSLQELSVREGVTLFMLLLAAFKTLLFKYTGQDDIRLAIPVSNRNHPEIEGLIGFFSNTLVLRTEMSGEPTFLELLQRVRRVVLGAIAHQDLPFEKLVEQLHPDRDLSRTPMAQALFTYMDGAADPLNLTGLKAELLETYNDTVQFDLVLNALRAERGIRISLSYNVDLFEDETAERMLAHFGNLLESISARPHSKLSRLRMLSPTERRRLLEGSNDAPADYSIDTCIHFLFEEQARKTPEAIAVSFEGRHLSYGELNRRANQMAHCLKSLGVAPEQKVAIYLDRSFELMVALLGTLKAGAVYVPLDPSYPKERLATMLEDSAPVAVLTETNFAEAISRDGSNVICLDRDRDRVASFDEDNPLVEVSPDNLAYVIFTSGSTGKPKGVMISHRAICNRLLWMRAAYPLTREDSLLQKTPVSFDASIWELFEPLITGARVVLARPGGQRDARYMVEAIAEHGITTLQLVPTMMKVLLDEPGLEDCKSLRLAFCGGEALPLELQQRMRDRLGIELQNLYGPTEASIDATCGPPVSRGNQGVAPIGRPLTNVRVYVVDKDFEPVPPGVAGDVMIAGAGLARGYLREPALTADRFIPDPHSPQPGGRMYRTGDIGRYRADGNLEYLGRKDQQVKLRGYRIELAEIEAALEQDPAVRESVVIVHGDDLAEKILVAYVVPADGEALAAAELRVRLKEKLPEFMVPSLFVEIESIPVMPNGKVDRRALPPIDEVRREKDSSYVRPKTAIEEVLAGIWEQVLGVRQVGAQDNFFDLGGHSLNATQVISRAREAFQVDLPLRALFETPTLSQLGRAIEAARKAAAGLDLQPIAPGPRGGALPLSFAQQRIWLLNQIQPEDHTFNLPVAVRLEGPFSVGAFEGAMNGVIARHEALRTRFVSTDAGASQLIEPRFDLHVPLVDLSQLPESDRRQQVSLLASEQARLPFDLSSLPLVRALIIRLRDDEHVLVVTIHHIVCDGWSMAIFIREVVESYAALNAGRRPELPQLPIQYADFAAFEREWMKGEEAARQLEYWKERLAGERPRLWLGRTEKARSGGVRRGRAIGFEIEEQDVRALRELGRREGVTMYMAMLGAYQVLLHRVSGEDVIVVGSPVANRRREEVEGLIGCFINTVEMKVELGGNPSFREVLRRVREVALGAYENQEAPYERVVEEVESKGRRVAEGGMQVWFTMQNTPGAGVEMGGMRVSEEPVEIERAQFEVAMVVGERGEKIEGRMIYDEGVIEREEAEELVNAYRMILRAVVREEERGILDLELGGGAGVIEPHPASSSEPEFRF